MCKNFCKNICKNICKKMCKMCKNCVNIFFPLCKIFAKFLHFSNLHSDFRPREESVKIRMQNATCHCEIDGCGPDKFTS